jgi:hypothetical protein
LLTVILPFKQLKNIFDKLLKLRNGLNGCGSHEAGPGIVSKANAVFLVLVGRNRPRFEVIPVVLTGPSAIDWVDEDRLSVLVVLRDDRKNVGIALSGEQLWHYPTNFLPSFFLQIEGIDRPLPHI